MVLCATTFGLYGLSFSAGDSVVLIFVLLPLLLSTLHYRYLNNDDADKLVLLDVPYIGSENTCSVAGYKYQPFHKKVADYLQNAEYPFIYYCRSTSPKSDNIFDKADAEHIMKMKLAQYFINKGYYFQKVRLDNDTELMVSNRQYDTAAQFQWKDMTENIT